MRTLSSTERCFRVDVKEIGYLKFILEAHEGIAQLSTLNSENLDAEKGRVRLLTAPGRETEAASLLEALKKEIRIES